MRLYTDHYFHIGRAHLTGGKPCQDHALSFASDDMACAIVADGCTTGGETDMGARILTFSTAAAVRDHWARTHSIDDATPYEINAQQRIVLGGTRYAFGLHQRDMLATCLYAYVTRESGFMHLRGDGIIAWQLCNGHIWMSRFDWADNKPFYPAYAEDNYASFIHAHGGDVAIHALTMQCWRFVPDEGFEDQGISRLTLAEGIKGITKTFSCEQVNNELAFLAVFSDGVTQVDGVDWKDVVVQLFAFKNVAGEFAKRRMIRVIKESEKIGKGPFDDIAYAVIRMAHTESEEEK